MCPTYGRVGLLEESIESFIRQDYQGEKELVVVNDLPEQELFLHDCPPNIRVINLRARCTNLGHKRNTVAEHCAGDLIMTWSDDDIHLPSRISNNVAAHSLGGYVTEGRYVFLHGERSKCVEERMCGPFLMGRSAFWDFGGIPDADNGEDLLFLNKVTQSLKMTTAPGTNYIYRWDTGRFHASQHDKKEGAWETYRHLVLQSIASGAEPSGLIPLKPTWRQDYSALALTFL
jgi:glycosyltransferase involved in cell wall biosynthesis